MMFVTLSFFPLLFFVYKQQDYRLTFFILEPSRSLFSIKSSLQTAVYCSTLHVSLNRNSQTCCLFLSSVSFKLYYVRYLLALLAQVAVTSMRSVSSKLYQLIVRKFSLVSSKYFQLHQLLALLAQLAETLAALLSCLLYQLSQLQALLTLLAFSSFCPIGCKHFQLN